MEDPTYVTPDYVMKMMMMSCNDLLDDDYKMIRDMHGKWAGIAQ